MVRITAYATSFYRYDATPICPRPRTPKLIHTTLGHHRYAGHTPSPQHGGKVGMGGGACSGVFAPSPPPPCPSPCEQGEGNLCANLRWPDLDATAREVFPFGLVDGLCTQGHDLVALGGGPG